MTQPGDELGAFTQVRLVHHAAVADLFSGVDQTGRPVVMVALTPEAGADQAWRSAFADLVNRDRASVNPTNPQFVAAHAGELQGPRPWVASRYEPGRRGIERILSVIPQALPPGADPTALIGAALAAAGGVAGAPAPGPQTQQWTTPGQPQGPYPGQPQGPYPGQPYPGQPQAVPPTQAGPPAAEQYSAASSAPYSAPVSPTPYSAPVSAAPQSGPPQSGAPQSAPMSGPPMSGPPMSGPPAPDPYSSPIGQPVSPHSGPPSSDPYSSPIGQSAAPQSAPPHSGAPQSGPPQSGPPAAPFAAGGYVSPDQSGYSEQPAYSESGGYPGQGTPAYADPAVPSGPDSPYAPPPPDSSKRGAGMLIGLITAVTALVIVAAGFAVVFINSGDEEDRQVAKPPPSPSASPLPADTAGPSPSPSRSPLPSTTPTIRTDVETVSVIGPTWQDEDKTQLLDLTGWPFAFRLPEGWSCLRGEIEELPDANAWGCVKTDGTSHQQRLNIMLRRCPTGCTAPEQQTMNEAWFDDEEEPKLKKFDATTTYVEIPKNEDGFYAVDFSHFFADKPGGKLTYQVGVWFQSPDKYKEEMQKSLNDVRTQAPQTS